VAETTRFSRENDVDGRKQESNRMKARNRIAVLSAALIVLPVFSFFASGGTGRNAEEKSQEAAPAANNAAPEGPAAAPDHKIIVYYFHGKRRCPTCMKLETYTREAVVKGFAELVKSGKVDFRVVNFDEPRDRHFTEDFKLYTKAVVIVDTLDGKQLRWKNLEKIWELVVNQFAFIKYVQDEINAYLREN
jgi:hypothetical protein